MIGSSVEQHDGPQHAAPPDFTADAISPYFCRTACRMSLLSMLSSIYAYANTVTGNNMPVRVYMSIGIY